MVGRFKWLMMFMAVISDAILMGCTVIFGQTGAFSALGITRTETVKIETNLVYKTAFYMWEAAMPAN